jgi:hypothetical protein
MNKDKRTGWIANLKAGDQVFVSWNGNLELKTVDRITPTGRTVINDSAFDDNGNLISNRDNWNRYWLVEATEERLEQYNLDQLRRSALRLMRDTPGRYENLSEEHANQIIQILSSYTDSLVSRILR